MVKLESMEEFFTSRVKIYDDHMLTEVEGCKEGYIHLANLLPENINTLLDLGCGTGLELETIFNRFPKLNVTGVDMTPAMLEYLKKKYYNKDIVLKQGNYLTLDLGFQEYDAVISFQTLHHLTHEEKKKIYKKIYDACKPGGCYIECDYMVLTQEEEDILYRENQKLRAEQDINIDEICHFDTPCTVENQLQFLKNAGFLEVNMVWRQENTTMIVGRK
jgi:ubiquinone/menaquinone biosynthesis C-methylase UbiE